MEIGNWEINYFPDLISSWKLKMQEMHCILLVFYIGATFFCAREAWEMLYFTCTSRPSRRRVITRRRVVCIPVECEDGPPSSRVCLACFVSFVYFFCRDPSDEFLRGGTLRPPAPPYVGIVAISCGGEHCAPPRPPSAWCIPFAPTPAGGGTI